MSDWLRFYVVGTEGVPPTQVPIRIERGESEQSPEVRTSDVYLWSQPSALNSLGNSQSSINDLQARARQSGGTSNEFIYEKVAEELKNRNARGVLVDVGCGIGGFFSFVRSQFESYIGVDAVRYPESPSGASFTQVDSRMCITLRTSRRFSGSHPDRDGVRPD